ncbi:hypothetical protein HNQ94_002236 [Salirhabdus euzebyi]|uniref:Cof-type HAD-IIB family hydrolase n=1 Tax=Salirhabdus euzebyi TaxID=394506 RepID=A0A841Q5X3_9BACI|nr:HAD family hydrolase [Salirhabdus euzebyi]MBB6453785.1 hypothetical protein [Salirhabdus euzebyi]
MDYKMIVIDMDGTLLDEQSTVSENVKDYIKELRKQGKLVFIATGRTLREAKGVLQSDFELDGIVTANGMAVFVKDEPLSQYALPPQLVEELVEKAEARGIFYEVHPNEGSRFALNQDKALLLSQISDPKPETVEENEWISRKREIDEIVWVDQLETNSIAKIYFFSKSKESIIKWKEEFEKMKRNIDFNYFSSSVHNVEVTVSNISKATGVQTLLDKFHLSKEDVMAIGDSENDLPLFEFAAYSVAMKNAPEIVKERANEITDFSYDEDGLYKYLKKTFS